MWYQEVQLIEKKPNYWIVNWEISLLYCYMSTIAVADMQFYHCGVIYMNPNFIDWIGFSIVLVCVSLYWLSMGYQSLWHIVVVKKLQVHLNCWKIIIIFIFLWLIKNNTFFLKLDGYCRSHGLQEATWPWRHGFNNRRPEETAASW